MKFFSFIFVSPPKKFSFFFFSQNLSLKKISFPPCTSHFESPGEDRQATPNRQIFKTGKGTVRIKTFLAKESQPRQLKPEWIERAETAHILPNQNEAALSLSNGGVFALIGKKGDFKKFSVPNLSKREGKKTCQIHLVNILLDPFPLVKNQPGRMRRGAKNHLHLILYAESTSKECGEEPESSSSHLICRINQQGMRRGFSEMKSGMSAKHGLVHLFCYPY
ncbi:hypothetical protein AVEN_230079-1 [Araneus ventricosus]|uniref:Uncharacterized protein n=1 Tax=Araneus ventricosus TaxID=182803 RepID=A0A4Y2GZR4_ARAVE|nr:hypothetical protein AVEN_230079-1 [Araneus ventricosus]